MTFQNWNKKTTLFSASGWIPYIQTSLFLLLPFIIFYWMIPFVTPLTFGNDYTRYPIHHQMELMFSLKTGSFPLFIPGFAGGQSSNALSLGQIFHPISHISALLPGYWNGRALEWNTLLRLLSLGGVHLFLFNFLIKLRIDRLMALIISIVTIYNLRMLDLFRYGASLESWTGHLLLCISIGNCWLDKRERVWPLMSIIGATYWLICSGHPQMMYYGLLGASLFTLVIPYYLAMMIPSKSVDLQSALRFYAKIGLYCTIGICLSSAYIIPYYFDFILSNAGRIAQGYAWADTYRDTFIGTLNNFFSPLRSDIHGAFGGSSLFLAASLIPILRLFKIKIPIVIWAIWGIAVILFLHMQGSRTLIHYLAWKTLPFASTFRIAGRISLILPILFMLILVWIVRAETINLRLSNRIIIVTVRFLISGIALLFIGIYYTIPDSTFSNPSFFSAVNIRQLSASIEWWTMGLGAGALLTFGIYGISRRKNHLVGGILLMFTCLQIISLLQNGTIIEQKKETSHFLMMLMDKQENLNYSASTGRGLSSATIVRQAKRSFLEPFLGRVYKEYIIAKNNEDAYNKMSQERLPYQVIIESPFPKNIPKNMEKCSGDTNDKVKLIYSSFNYLKFDVQTSCSSFFGLSYPYSGHWRARVNNQNAHIFRANGAAHAVWIPAGKNHVEFYYKSNAATCGMLLSCITLISISFLFSLKASKKHLGIAITAFTLLSGVCGFMLWYQSLYNGENIGTRYEWVARSSSDPKNMAYGRQTRMSSHLSEDYPYFFTSRRAVDEDRRLESGFVTKQQLEPWWMVDLQQKRQIGSVVIHEGMIRPNFNNRPIVVALSEDGKIWQKGAVISKPVHHAPFNLIFEKKYTARFILIKASGYCHLSLDEVEVFP